MNWTTPQWRPLAMMLVGIPFWNACTTPPQNRASSPTVMDSSTRLAALRSKSLILSNDDRSAAAQFDIRLQWSGHLPDGGSFSYDCIVARNEDRVAVVLLSADGLPFCYMANNFLLKAEPDGRWVEFTQGSPVVVFERMLDQDRFQVFASFMKNTTATNVRVDLGSIVDGIIRKATHTTLDADDRTLHVQTDRAEAILDLPPPSKDDVFPLKALAVRSTNGSTAAAFAIHLRSPLVIPTTITLEDLNRMGIVVRQPDPADFQESPLLPPADFSSNVGSRQAATTLARLLSLSLPLPRSKAGT